MERWLQEEYATIRAKAKQEKAEIHWGDEMSLRPDGQGGRGYGKHEHSSFIQETGYCLSCNMISTITNQRKLHFMMFQDRLTQPVLLAFLRRLLRSAKGKVFLFVKGHPVYHGKMVQRWLAAQQDHISLSFLPGQS